MRTFLAISIGCVLTSCLLGTYTYKSPPKENPIRITEKWSSSVNLGIGIHRGARDVKMLTTGHFDFKPSWSLEGDKITFFRSDRYMGPFDQWKTQICAINEDGTGLTLLTDGKYADYNPTWTRDGSEQIVFNRYARKGVSHCEIYMVNPSGVPGDEILISDPAFDYFEWAMSCLKDGRIFVDRTTPTQTKSFLLTPNPGGKGAYQEVERPTKKLWHKLSISPDETKVCYMLDNDYNTGTYEDVVLAFADFDKANLAVKNQVIITEFNPSNIYEYPRWTPDGKHIVYDANRTGTYQVYAYRIEDGTTVRLTTNSTLNYSFPHFRGAPK
jgi:hypothetical protein